MQFLPNIYSQEEFADGIHELTIENWIFKFDEFYTLQNDYALIIRRRKGNMEAKRFLKTAEKIAGFLSVFPFVRGVAVSGSLSKNYADENSDIDFFIITEKNKLWLARTFMHAFKKISYLFKKQDWFCMNYYIDEEMLQIKEKNIYTAIEVATLLPLRGIGSFRDFYSHNRWSKDFLPAHALRISYIQESKNSFFKKAIELIFRNPLGNLLDHLLMNITASRWQKKTNSNKRNKRGIVLSMDVSRHYAKPNPENFQNKLIAMYEKKLFHLFRRYENKAKTVF
jgi:predicted nucleotidyltransferase